MLVTESVPPEHVEMVSIQALYKIEGDPLWYVDDWTHLPHVSFCPDAREECLEQLVIVMTNTEHKNRSHRIRSMARRPRLIVSDMGCWRWQGTASVRADLCSDESVVTDEQQVVGGIWERTESYPNIPYPAINFRTRAGDWRWQVEGSGSGCTLSGSDSGSLGEISLDTMDILSGTLAGPSHRRYLGLGIVMRPSGATLTCPEGSGSAEWAHNAWYAPNVFTEDRGTIFTVGTDGTMASGEDTYFEGDSGTVTYTWRFRPLREP
jgi:hypothetical protein